MTVVQIFGLEHPDDAVAVAALGVDHLGFSIGDALLPDNISLAEGTRVFSRLPDRVTTVALFATADPDLVTAVAQRLRPSMVQLCWPMDALGPAIEAALRERLRPVRVIKEIAVGGPDTREAALSAAKRYAISADFFILDTAPAGLPWIGATGQVHDWAVSRDIIAASPIPCILAGGLGPDNVADAIRVARPWGVDSFSRTNLPNGRKDLARVRAFLNAAKSA
jgi:phosphoribosylanthranilate isomerase